MGQLSKITLPQAGTRSGFIAQAVRVSLGERGPANDFEAADLHSSKVKTAESPGVSRATIYRKIHQYGIITPAS